jgi:hypothetical protein
MASGFASEAYPIATNNFILNKNFIPDLIFPQRPPHLRSGGNFSQGLLLGETPAQNTPELGTHINHIYSAYCAGALKLRV